MDGAETVNGRDAGAISDHDNVNFRDRERIIVLTTRSSTDKLVTPVTESQRNLDQIISLYITRRQVFSSQ